MRAVVVREFGGPESLRVEDLPVPVPGPGRVLVRVAAAAVNPVDPFTAAGGFAELGLTAPLVPGWDVAGAIESVAPDVTTWHPGDQVVALRDFEAAQSDGGTAQPEGGAAGQPNGPYADYLTLPVEALAAAPAGVSLVDASTLPLNGLTAVQALDQFAELGLPAGGTVLVTGAAGAVGGYVVELAAARGLRVIATAGANDEKAVRAFGATDFIPRRDDLSKAVREIVPGGVDAVIDPAFVGAEAVASVRDGGAFLAVAEPARPAPERELRIDVVHVHADAAQLADLVTRVEAGTLTLRTAATYPLAEAADAHRRLAAGGLRGRLVLVTG
jgi:NADPH2:quinone reductase